MVMYEWKDVPYLGAVTPDEGVGRPAHPVRSTLHNLLPLSYPAVSS